MEALEASTDVLRKALLSINFARSDEKEHRIYIASSQIGFRVVNDAAATTVLLDRGYFIQAVALMRCLAEIGMLLTDISNRGVDLEMWSRSIGHAQNRNFRRSSFRNRIGSTKEFIFFDRYFDHFSEIGTHVSSVSISLMHDGQTLHVGPHFNRNCYLRCYRDLSTLVWHATKAAGPAFELVFGASVESLFPKEVDRFELAWAAIS